MDIRMLEVVLVDERLRHDVRLRVHAYADQIQLVLLRVKVSEADPEHDSGDEGNDTGGTVVPDDMGVGGEGVERLGDGVTESGGEVEDGHDEGAHVLRRLCERVLEPGDGREDLGEGDEDVCACLDPDVQVGGGGTRCRRGATRLRGTHTGCAGRCSTA